MAQAQTQETQEKKVSEEPRRPITRAYAQALLEAQNNTADGTNQRNEEMQENTEATSDREDPESLTISEAKNEYGDKGKCE